MEKLRELKRTGIQRQNKAKVEEITKRQKKSFLNIEEKKAKKIFYEKSQALQVSRVSIPFKA